MEEGINILQTWMVALVIIGVVLASGFLILEKVRDTSSDTLSTVYNWTGSNTTAHTFTPTYGVISSLVVKNWTGQTQTADNYTIVQDAEFLGTIILKEDSTGMIGTNVSLTYNYYSSVSFQETNTIIKAVGEVPTWLPIVIIVAIAGIILTLVFKYIPGASGGEGY